MSLVKITDKSLEFRFPMRFEQNGDEKGMKIRWSNDVDKQMEELCDKWLKEHPEFKDVPLYHYNSRIVFDIGTHEEVK